MIRHGTLALLRILVQLITFGFIVGTVWGEGAGTADVQVHGSAFLPGQREPSQSFVYFVPWDWLHADSRLFEERVGFAFWNSPDKAPIVARLQWHGSVYGGQVTAATRLALVEKIGDNARMTGPWEFSVYASARISVDDQPLVAEMVRSKVTVRDGETDTRDPGTPPARQTQNRVANGVGTQRPAVATGLVAPSAKDFQCVGDDELLARRAGGCFCAGQWRRCECPPVSMTNCGAMAQAQEVIYSPNPPLANPPLKLIFVPIGWRTIEPFDAAVDRIVARFKKSTGIHPECSVVQVVKVHGPCHFGFPAQSRPLGNFCVKNGYWQRDVRDTIMQCVPEPIGPNDVVIGLSSNDQWVCVGFGGLAPGLGNIIFTRYAESTALHELGHAIGKLPEGYQNAGADGLCEDADHKIPFTCLPAYVQGQRCIGEPARGDNPLNRTIMGLDSDSGTCTFAGETYNLRVGFAEWEYQRIQERLLGRGIPETCLQP
jgi:hypothetical protein